MKEVSTISKRKSRSRPQNRRQQPRPVNKGYGDAGASWHKKATKGFRAMSGSPKEDIDANNYTLRQRARMLYMAAPIATCNTAAQRNNDILSGDFLLCQKFQHIAQCADMLGALPGRVGKAAGGEPCRR